ncbi:MAG: CHAT domain-containing protein [Thermomicrobiales bacterium]
MAARVDANLGAVCVNIGEAESAIGYCERARPAFADESISTAQVDSNLGLAFLQLDEYAKAESAFRRALPVFTGASLYWGAAMVEGNLAELCTKQGRIQEAFQHFERTRRHLEHDESPEELARVLCEHAAALLLVGLNDEAARQYDAALAQLVHSGQQLEIAKASVGQADAALRIESYDVATNALDIAEQALGEFDQPGLRAQIETLRAELALTMGDLAAATKHGTNVLTFVRDRPVASALGQALGARIAMESGDDQRAMTAVNAALPTADRFEITPLRAELLHLRGLLARRIGNHQAGMEDLLESVNCVERVRSSIQADRFRTAFHGNRLSVYSDLIEIALQTGTPEAIRLAYETTERAKSRALLDLARQVGDAVDRDPAPDDPHETELLALLATQRRRLEQFYSKIAEDRFGTHATSAISPPRNEIHALETSIAELESRVGSAGGQDRDANRALTVAEAQSRIASSEAIVEYFIANDELIGFCLTKSSLVCKQLGHVPEIVDALKRLRFQMQKGLQPLSKGPRSERMLADVRRELAGLYDKLLRPFSADLTGIECLRIIPHGPLHALPFHALWDGSAYVIENFEVIVAPSASFMLRNHEDGTSTETSAVVIGVADELAPAIAREAEQVATMFDQSKLLIGDQATADAVCSHLPRITYAHLASHGQYVPDTPAASGLLMADRWLTVREIQKLRLRARLVTLSGCETGRVDVEHGDEIVGLLRPFLAAGAQTLLVSFWKVSDICTLEFMKLFYAALLDGDQPHSVTAALRTAQCRQLRDTPHPALWGSFCLVGAK